MESAGFYRRLAAESRPIGGLAVRPDDLRRFGNRINELTGEEYLSFKYLITVDIPRRAYSIDAPAGGGLVRISELEGSGLTDSNFTNQDDFFNAILADDSPWRNSNQIDQNILEALESSGRQTSNEPLRDLIWNAYRYNVENADNENPNSRYLLDPAWTTPVDTAAVEGLSSGKSVTESVLGTEEEEESLELQGAAAVSFLLNRQQGVLATLNERIIEDFFDFDMIRQRNIIPISSEDESLLINFLQKRPNLLPYFAIRTPYLSLLVPKIRLFKKVYTRNTDGSFAIADVGNLEFKFKSFTENSDIEDITSHNFGRAGGAGIKNVNWAYEGTNPEAVKSFVSFDISLFFQSLSDFVGSNATDAEQALLDPDSVDLINLIGAGIGVADESGQTQYKFEITAQLGWELDQTINHDLAEDQKIRDLKAVISQTNTNLRLSLQEHNINFNEDGTLTLDISYFSAIDEVFTDESLNILRIGLPDGTGIQTVRETKDAPDPNTPEGTTGRDVAPERDPCARSSQVTNGSETSDPSDDEEPTAVDLAIAAALQGSDDENIIQNYNNIFSKMIESNRIYRVRVNTDEVLGLVGDAEIERNNVAESEIEVRYLTEAALRGLSGADTGLNVERVSMVADPVSDSEQAKVVAAAKEADYETGENLLSDAELGAAMNQAILNRFDAVGSNGMLNIDFIRLGDLLDNIIEGLQEIPGTPLQEREEDFLFVTGLYTYRETAAGIRKAYNYSDMLISIDAFRAFFTEKIIRPLKVKYNLTSFIIDIANKFSYVNSVGMASQGTFVSAEGRPTFATFQAPDVGLGEALRVANTINALGELGFGGFTRYYHSLNNADPAYFSEIVGDSNPASSSDPRREISYFVLRSSGHVIQRDGKEAEDIEEGIYHLKLGSDKGILKSVKFRKDEIRGRREGRIVRAGGLNLAALREKYDATITIFGAPFIYPGMYIYLNPSLIGYGAGSDSAAKILGLGGYYFINKVRNSISSDGSFDTEIEASWNAFAGTDCDSDEVEIIQAPPSAVNEVLQAGAHTAVYVDAADREVEVNREGTPMGVPTGGTGGTPAAVPRTSQGRQ